MIRAIVVDDERAARDVLKSLLNQNFPDVNIAGEASNGDEMQKVVEREKPELLFLDVELGKQNIFDVLPLIDLNNTFIIFTTAHDGYALQAIKFSALAYLLKPISKEDLGKAMEKVQDRLKNNNMKALLEVLKNNVSHPAADRKIVLSTANKLEIVPINEIMYCESDRNYVTFFLSGKRKILISKTMQEYEELLENCNFYRIHHSYLINLAFLKSYAKGEGGYVILQDGTQLEVSRRKKEGLMKKLSTL